VLANRFHEITSNVILTRHLFGPLVFACSRAKMASLSERQRAALLEAAVFARDMQRALAPVRERQALQALAQQGMALIPADTEALEARVEKMRRETAAGLNVGDLLVRILAERAAP